MPGTIYSGTYFSGIYLSNAGTQNPASITSTGSVTNTTGDAVLGAAGTAWTLNNAGTIAGPSSFSGVRLNSGGTVDNTGGITGGINGVRIEGAPGSVVNQGSIFSTAATTAASVSAVYFQNGGQLTNHVGALVQAYRAAISIGDTFAATGSVTVTNSGTVIGSTGLRVGSLDTADNTLINAGTIIGTAGAAAAFGSGNDLLVIDPGAVFNGTVTGGGGVNTLELASGTGTIAGIGSSFTGFGRIVVDAGADWTLADAYGVRVPSGAGTVINHGTLHGTGNTAVRLDQGGTVTNDGSIAAAASNGVGVYLTAGGSITNTQTGVILGGGETGKVGAFAAGKAAFMTGSNDPWNIAPGDPGSPESAMNTAFGAGNWVKFQGFTTTPLTAGYKFIYLDGGDGASDEFNAFIAANRATLEAFVAAGGELFINAARYTHPSLDMGFGATLVSGYSVSGNAISPSERIFQGPNGSAGTSWTGDYFSHDAVTGTGLHPLITGSSGVSLAGEHYGAGYVLFGGITDPFFHSPQPNANILRANILDFVAAGGGVSAGVYLRAGGTVSNSGTIAGEESGIQAGGDASVTNNGLIVGIGLYGLELAAGGRLTNSAGAGISGGRNGVSVSGGPGTIINSGNIASDLTAGQHGVALRSNGTVINNALIQGRFSGSTPPMSRSASTTRGRLPPTRPAGCCLARTAR